MFYLFVCQRYSLEKYIISHFFLTIVFFFWDFDNFAMDIFQLSLYENRENDTDYITNLD